MIAYASAPRSSPLRGEGRSRLSPGCLPRPASCHLQVEAVGLVELRGLRIRRAAPVERVEVEARRARLQELRRRHVLVEHDVGLVEREVVVDELAEVRETGWNLPCASAACRHRLADLPGVRLAELAVHPARPHAREAKRRHLRLDRGCERALPASGALCQKSLADDEVALRAVLVHTASRRRAEFADVRRSPSSTLQPERVISTRGSRRAAAVASRQTDSRRTLSGRGWIRRALRTCALSGQVPSKEGRARPFPGHTMGDCGCEAAQITARQKISGHQGARSERKRASARARPPRVASSTSPARDSSANERPPR